MDRLTAAQQGLSRYRDEQWTCKHCQGHERYVLGNFCCTCQTLRVKKHRQKFRQILTKARRKVKTLASP